MSEAEFMARIEAIVGKIKYRRWLRSKRGSKNLLRTQRGFRRYRKDVLPIRVIIAEANQHKTIIDLINKM